MFRHHTGPHCKVQCKESISPINSPAIVIGEQVKTHQQRNKVVFKEVFLYCVPRLQCIVKMGENGETDWKFLGSTHSLGQVGLLGGEDQ